LWPRRPIPIRDLTGSNATWLPSVITGNRPGRNIRPGQTIVTTGEAQSLYPSKVLGERAVFRTIQRLDVVAAVTLTGAAVVVALATEKISNLLIGAAMVACVLLGLRVILESMLDRIANDSYDSGKASERRAIVRDLADSIAQKNHKAG